MRPGSDLPGAMHCRQAEAGGERWLRELKGRRRGGNRGPAKVTFCWMDEGLPIAYEVLDQGVPVYCSDGEQVGTVDHVIAAPAEDIFHGIVLRAEGGRRFVAADQVTSLHEHGVDLRIDAAAAAALPEPGGGALALRLREPGVKPKPLDAHPGPSERQGFAPAGLDRGGLGQARRAAARLRWHTSHRGTARRR